MNLEESVKWLQTRESCKKDWKATVVGTIDAEVEKDGEPKRPKKQKQRVDGAQCTNCGMVHRWVGKCPASTRTCYLCDQVGHYTNYCPTRKVKSGNQAPVSAKQPHAVNCACATQPPTVTYAAACAARPPTATTQGNRATSYAEEEAQDREVFFIAPIRQYDGEPEDIESSVETYKRDGENIAHLPHHMWCPKERQFVRKGAQPQPTLRA